MDSVVAFVFLGAGLFLLLKMFDKPGMRNSKPTKVIYYQHSESPGFSNLPFSNPRWGNFKGSADDTLWTR